MKAREQMYFALGQKKIISDELMLTLKFDWVVEETGPFREKIHLTWISKCGKALSVLEKLKERYCA